MQARTILRSVTVLISFYVFGLFEAKGGSVGGGGGTPPSVELDKARLQSLQESALKGDLIRITQPGADPVYLRPDLGSMKLNSFSANDLPSGRTALFYAEPPIERKQTQLALSLVRSMRVSMGNLPLLPSDFEVRPLIRIDAVPETEIDENILNKFNTSASDLATQRHY
jgi:hypothetical protein